MTQHDSTSGPASPTDPADIEREIAERRAHLAATIDELTDRVKPGNVARRSVADVKQRGRDSVRTPDGSLRTERVAAVGAAAASLMGVVGAAVWRKRR